VRALKTTATTWIVVTVSLAMGAHAQAQTESRDVAPAPGLVPSGVRTITPSLVPNAGSGPSLTPASIPNDPKASMELRRHIASRVRKGRNEGVVPVPPSLEIEVLDPNVDPLGNPAVIPSQDAAGHTIVDIPPVVLVHRYYYTGDRSFQGPMFPGGPSIVVINHPRTGERLYVEMQMLPGAPRVHYTSSSVEYDYGPQSIFLKFGHHGGKPSVVYRQGLGIGERMRLASEARHDRIDKWVERTGLPEAGGKIREGAGNALGATADGVRAVGKAAVAPVVRIIQATPIGSVLKSDPAKDAERERDTMTRRAEAEAKRVGADIPTLR